jgi:transcriptional regulator with XRE-family HTH domain
MKKFYEKIRDIRKLNGFSQEYVSYEIGLSQSQYSRRENGVIEFSYYEVDKLCKLFNINPDSLTLIKNTEHLKTLENIENSNDDNKNKILIDFILNTFDLLLNNNFSSEEQLKIVNDIKAKLIQK